MIDEIDAFVRSRMSAVWTLVFKAVRHVGLLRKEIVRYPILRDLGIGALGAALITLQNPSSSHAFRIEISNGLKIPKIVEKSAE